MKVISEIFDLFYLCLTAAHYARKGDYKTATKLMERV